MSRIGCYVRAHLHRRVFLMFVVAIMVSGCTVFGVLSLLGGSDLRRQFEGTRAFMVDRFVESWDVPAERTSLAKGLYDRVSLTVTLRDPEGQIFETYGPTCSHGVIPSPVVRDGKLLGTVEVCSASKLRYHLNLGLALGAAGIVLFALSAAISRKVTGSLVELARAASEIGQGRYDTDIRMHRRAPGEFTLLAEALRDMAAKIKKQMADHRELLASVSHEIRSPLARIRLLLELAKPDGDGDKPTGDDPLHNRALADIEREVLEIDELVGALLANSRVDFSALTRRPTDVVEAVERAVKRASVRAKIETVGSRRPARVDATLFARALGNLFENAAVHARGVESVRVCYGDTAVRVEVLDRGDGFLPGEEEKLFQSFYRRPNGKHDSLGLGLSLVRRIAEAHGGSVFARNREGGGAVVGFELPLPGTEAAE